MAIVHHTQKAGLPAGSLVYMGTREATRIGVTEIRYSADSYDAMPQSPDRITKEDEEPSAIKMGIALGRDLVLAGLAFSVFVLDPRKRSRHLSGT